MHPTLQTLKSTTNLFIKSCRNCFFKGYRRNLLHVEIWQLFAYRNSNFVVYAWIIFLLRENNPRITHFELKFSLNAIQLPAEIKCKALLAIISVSDLQTALTYWQIAFTDLQIAFSDIFVIQNGFSHLFSNILGICLVNFGNSLVI